MILSWFKILVLVVWLLFLGWLLSYGKNDLVRLLHPRLWWILYAAFWVLLIYLVAFWRKGDWGKQKGSLLELPGLLILLVPVLYFLHAKDARLDGATLQNRIIANDNGIYLHVPPFLPGAGDGSADEMVFSKIFRDPKEYLEEEVEVVCQSFVHEDLPENTAMCYRYLITCCAADAMPIFLILKETEGHALENDRWVKVTGPLSLHHNNGVDFPAIRLKKAEYVKEPSFPWAM